MKKDPQAEANRIALHRALAEGEGLSTLESLEQGTESLKAAFQEDPHMAVTGELFQIAQQISEGAGLLAEHFQANHQAELEERALRVRYDSLVTAHTYRRNVVGPAVLDWADCLGRNGERERAEALYEKVIKDFAQLLGWGPTFDPDWLVAVQCLERALISSQGDFTELRERTRAVLLESEQLVAARASAEA
ncbi:MAG: hypothetical protein WC314_23455 [Vulcanimicrobiota bacterium]